LPFARHKCGGYQLRPIAAAADARNAVEPANKLRSPDHFPL